jgi:hypothetical protein
MTLTELEKQSAVWRKLEAYLQDQLTSLRSQNDGDLNAEATARLRGKIAQLKTILVLGESLEPVQAEAD